MMSWLRSWMNRRQQAAGDDARARLGRTGERQAARFLRRKGYRIVTRNYRCAGGELDLVALDGTTIVFVEVKTRSSRVHADPQDAVTPLKQERLMRAARTFIQHTGSQGREFRFDVVALEIAGRRTCRIEHLTNAFSPARRC